MNKKTHIGDAIRPTYDQWLIGEHRHRDQIIDKSAIDKAATMQAIARQQSALLEKRMSHSIKSFVRHQFLLNSNPNRFAKAMSAREIALANRIIEEFVPTEIHPLLKSHPEAFSKAVCFDLLLSNGERLQSCRLYLADRALAKDTTMNTSSDYYYMDLRTQKDFRSQELRFTQLHVYEPEPKSIPRKYHVAVPMNLGRRTLSEGDFTTPSQLKLLKDIKDFHHEFVQVREGFEDVLEKLDKSLCFVKTYDELSKERPDLVKYLPENL